MTSQTIQLAKEIGRVPSAVVPLRADEEKRYERLVEATVMVDVHQHPFVIPEDMDRFIEHLRGNKYLWGYEAVKHGGWAAVATANVFRGLLNTEDMSYVDFEELAESVVVKDFQPIVRFRECGDSNINYIVIFSAKDRGNTFLLTHEFMKRVHARFPGEGSKNNYTLCRS